MILAILNEVFGCPLEGGGVTRAGGAPLAPRVTVTVAVVTEVETSCTVTVLGLDWRFWKLLTYAQ